MSGRDDGYAGPAGSKRKAENAELQEILASLSVPKKQRETNATTEELQALLTALENKKNEGAISFKRAEIKRDGQSRPPLKTQPKEEPTHSQSYTSQRTYSELPSPATSTRIPTTTPPAPAPATKLATPSEHRYQSAAAASSSSSTSYRPAPSPSPRPSSPPKPLPRVSPVLLSKGTLQAPSIPRAAHPGISPIPYTSRQSSLLTLFNTFVALYSPLVPRPHAASEKKDPEATSRRSLLLKRLVHHFASHNAITTESKVFKNSNINFLAYRNSVRTTLVGLSKRQKADKEADNGEASMHRLGEQIQAALADRQEAVASDSTEVERVIAIEEEVMKLLNQSILIGTSDEVEQKSKEREERLKGRLDIDRLEAAKLLTSRDILQAVGYPCPPSISSAEILSQEHVDSAWGEGGSQRTKEDSSVECERCGTSFIVAPLGAEDAPEREACSYHWGKRRYVREANVAKGPRLPRWTCCDSLDEATTFASDSLSQIASAAGFVQAGDGQANRQTGCTRGPHVFKEESSELLHQREAFLTTERVRQDLLVPGTEESKRTAHEVLAFDCELIYTTAGMSLARLTVLDEAGAVILDQYVRPRAPVVDYNTRFSGINEADLQDVTVDLAEARRKMATFMDTSTVLVGHGLENDLKALRLVHLRVADSALLYEHHKGLPFRFGLRDLTLKHLGKHIQSGDATAGHDPEEDARSALELVRAKYREVMERGVQAKPDVPTNPPLTPIASEETSTRPRPEADASTFSPTQSKPATKTAESGPSAAAKASLFIKPAVRRKKTK